MSGCSNSPSPPRETADVVLLSAGNISRWALAPVFGQATAANAVRLIKSAVSSGGERGWGMRTCVLRLAFLKVRLGPIGPTDLLAGGDNHRSRPC